MTEFRPFVFYNKAGNCLEVYLSNSDYYSDYVDNTLSILRDMNSNEIVGFVVNNIDYIVTGRD
jgi:hypothetical protein